MGYVEDFYDGMPVAECRSFGLEHIGTGEEAVAFRRDDTVIKVIKETPSALTGGPLTQVERARFASQMREDHAAMVEYVGAAVVPHEIIIDENPLVAGKESIQIIQPYYELKFLDLSCPTDEVRPVAQTLRSMHFVRPNLLENLSEIVQGSKALLSDRDLATDILGFNNIGYDFEARAVRIIDSQPTPPASTGHPYAIEALERLERALEIATA